jgi:cbb3-type cytochrome oxidase subunit 3
MGLIDSTVPTAEALVSMPDSAATIAVGLVSILVVCFMTGLQKAQLEANARANYSDLRARSTPPPERPSSGPLH